MWTFLKFVDVRFAQLIDLKKNVDYISNIMLKEPMSYRYTKYVSMIGVLIFPCINKNLTKYNKSVNKISQIFYMNSFNNILCFEKHRKNNKVGSKYIIQLCSSNIPIYVVYKYK